MWLQKEIKLSPRKRGFHLVTDEILRQLPELRKLDIGLLNVFIKHSSASLTINENADPQKNARRKIMYFTFFFKRSLFSCS